MGLFASWCNCRYNVGEKLKELIDALAALTLRVTANEVAIAANKIYLTAQVQGLTTVVAGDAVAIPVPKNCVLTDAVFWTTGSHGGDAIEIDIQDEGLASVLSTPYTIDAGETSNVTAAVPGVIDTALDDFVKGELCYVVVTADSAGDATGLYVTLEFTPA